MSCGASRCAIHCTWLQTQAFFLRILAQQSIARSLAHSKGILCSARGLLFADQRCCSLPKTVSTAAAHARNLTPTSKLFLQLISHVLASWSWCAVLECSPQCLQRAETRQRSSGRLFRARNRTPSAGRLAMVVSTLSPAMTTVGLFVFVVCVCVCVCVCECVRVCRQRVTLSCLGSLLILDVLCSEFSLHSDQLQFGDIKI